MEGERKPQAPASAPGASLQKFIKSDGEDNAWVTDEEKTE